MRENEMAQPATRGNGHLHFPFLIAKMVVQRRLTVKSLILKAWPEAMMSVSSTYMSFITLLPYILLSYCRD